MGTGQRREERGEWVRGEGRNGGGDWRRRVQIRLHVVWPQKPRRKIIWNTEPLKEGPEEDMRGEVLQWLFMEAPLVLALQRGGGGGRRGVRGSVEHWEAGILEAPRHLRKGRKSGINICWGRVGTGGRGAGNDSGGMPRGPRRVIRRMRNRGRECFREAQHQGAIKKQG